MCTWALFIAKVEAPLPLIISYMQALVYDFQPKDPENLYAALAVISNKAIPGDLTPFCLSLFKVCSISK